MDSLLLMTLGAMFLAGAAGGVHCGAMCGPLIGIACGSRGDGPDRSRWWRHALAYNAGRITTYVAAGMLTGAVGAAGLAVRGTPLAQQALLAAMGVAMIVLAAYVAGLTPLVRGIEAAGGFLWRRVQPYSRRFLPVDTPTRAFGLGLVWGWLPCGMVYAALIAALATADPAHGALVMAALGLGTLPNVLAISAFFGHFARMARGRLARSVVAAVIATTGVAGIAHAWQPARAAAVAFCLEIPGLSAWLGGGH